MGVKGLGIKTAWHLTYVRKLVPQILNARYSESTCRLLPISQPAFGLLSELYLSHWQRNINQYSVLPTSGQASPMLLFRLSSDVAVRLLLDIQ